MGRPSHNRKRHCWTPREEAWLRKVYANCSTRALALALRLSVTQASAHASTLGLKKSAEFLARVDRELGKHVAQSAASIAHRFQPGTIPANKGVRFPGYAPGRMAETQFKKGQRPHTWKPIGSTRHDDDGYLCRKISDTGYPPRDWRPLHHLLWQELHGPLPSANTHALVFKDGDKDNITDANLELITRAELMRRNTIHRLPKELVEVIQLKGAIKRVITCRKREIDAKERNPGPAQPSL